MGTDRSSLYVPQLSGFYCTAIFFFFLLKLLNSANIQKLKKNDYNICIMYVFIIKEKGAVKKLQNITKDHEERLKKLQEAQDEDKIKAELITNNLDLVDNSIQIVRQAVAKQMHWDEILDMIRQLNFEDDGNTYAIVKNLKLNVNHITLELL